MGDGGAGWESGDSLCRGLVEGGNMASLRVRKATCPQEGKCHLRLGRAGPSSEDWATSEGLSWG